MDTYGFELIKEADIAELNTHAKYFRHVPTGAELLSLENDDENKCFGINFRTPPKDSTGIAHIMEHSVLCGSRKFPLKDPFIELAKGSLNTFLNAFTYPDKTCYPIASTNLQDFYNLVDVYLDAVFHPLIPPETLQQEGWHYELEDAAAPLTFKGIVFNEMKGVYSSPDSLLGRYSRTTLYPDNTYGVDSGGDPQHIPDLTYKQFKTFHETYYHPSNAYIFFYGDDDPAARLRILQEYLQDFQPLDIDSTVKLQPKFDQPRRITMPYDAGEDAAHKKGYITVNWLLPETTNLELRMGLSILSYIIIGTQASVLRKTLLDSDLGENVTGGLESEMRQMSFTAGLKGIAVDDAAKVEKLILDTLAKLVKEGLDPDMIEAAFNTFEFSLRENNTGSFPRGLSLMLRALTTWLHDDNPLSPLAFEAPLAAIKANLAADKSYFETLVQQHLLDNNHRVSFILEPDASTGQKQETAEKERLAQAQAAMSKIEVEAVIKQARKLKELQQTPDSPEALAMLPSLTLDDLDKQNKSIPRTILEENEATVLHHDLFTNGIVYLNVGFNMHTLPQNLLPYTSLFTQALLKIGLEKESYVKLSQRIGRKTGGIWPSTMTSAIQQQDQGTAWFFLQGKATISQADDMLDIMRDILLTVKLDNPERFKQMVLQAKAGAETSLIPSGHLVVTSRLRANFNEIDWIDEQMGGISYLFFLRQLIEDIEQDWPAVLAKLEGIRQILLNRNGMVCNVTLDDANWKQFQPKFKAFLSAMPTAPLTINSWTPDPGPGSEGLTMPAKVNYVAKGTNLYQLGYKLHGSYLVITNYLRTTWLWEQIRIQGGAYSGSCSFDPYSGMFNFLSYRDPNLLKTLDNYDASSQFLKQLDLSQSELTKSIIGAISRIDAYQLPDAKGYTSLVRYLVGSTAEDRQKRRDEILSTTLADFKQFADVLAQVNKKSLVVVLGSPDVIARANAERNNWLKVQKVM